MKDIKLTLTAKHLRKASQKDCCENCIVATALKERFPGKFISVGFLTATIGGDNYVVNTAGQVVIDRFMEENLKPADFPLVVILNCQR